MRTRSPTSAPRSIEWPTAWRTSLATEVAARARAEQLLAANRDLVANVSHELRTPVALIRSHLEALEDDPSNGDEYTRIALRETDRLERLVNDLFQLVRLENHIVKLEREPIDAASAVREAVESLVEPTRRIGRDHDEGDDRTG